MALETLEVIDAPPAVEPEAPKAPQTTDEIERELLATQQSLANKIGILEERTVGSIRETIGAVNDTVSSVQSVVTDPLGAMQSAISNPIESVKEGVTSTVSKLFHEFDPSALVKQHPLASMGVAVLGGFAASLLLFRNRTAPQQARAFTSTPGGASETQEPNLFQSLLGTLGAEAMKVGRQVVEEASKSIVDKAKTAMGNFGVGTPTPEAEPAVRL